MPPKKTATENGAPATTAAGATSTKKAANSRNNVGNKDSKVSEKPSQDNSTVKSGENKPEKRGRGRPTGSGLTYSEAVAANICDLLAEGMPLREICKLPDMPAWRTVYLWREKYADFDARINRSRVAGFDAIAEECLEIADHTANDTIVGENGERANAEWISRSKLRIETRLRLLSKWDPKRFGDKVDVNHGIQPENPLATLLGQIQGTPLRPKDKAE